MPTLEGRVILDKGITDISSLMILGRIACLGGMPEQCSKRVETMAGHSVHLHIASSGSGDDSSSIIWRRTSPVNWSITHMPAVVAIDGSTNHYLGNILQKTWLNIHGTGGAPSLTS